LVRTVRRDPQFEEQALQIQPDAWRLDEVLDAVEWSIAMAAESWHLVEGPEGTAVRLAITTAFPGGAPALWIYFTIDDDDYCTLRAVELAKSLRVFR
jgi:hypothetical protein